MEKQKTKKLEVALPSAMTIALGKENLKKNKKTPFAECRCCGTRQRGLKKQISLPTAGAMALGKEFFFKKKIRRRQIFAECLKFGTRQSSLYRKGIRRRLFAECCTRQRHCRVQSCLCQVQQALGKEPTSSSDAMLLPADVDEENPI